MDYQSTTGLRCFMFMLGSVFAPTRKEAEQFATRHGLWDRRPDGTWGLGASKAHAELSFDLQAAYRSLACREVQS